MENAMLTKEEGKQLVTAIEECHEIQHYGASYLYKSGVLRIVKTFIKDQEEKKTKKKEK